MAPILSVSQLKKIYPGSLQKSAVDDISFSLQEGEILGFLGPNGSGKTTTIQMLLGTLKPTSGTILYFSQDFSTHRIDILQHVSYASSYTSLPWVLTIEENLCVFGRLYGISPEETKILTTPLLQRFGIYDKKQAKISSLSAGQVTRLMLVKAFFVRPKIILLDEPTASLDPDISDEICSFILEQNSKNNLSILFTSHKMEEVTKLCDRVIFLKNGKIVANDLPKNLASSASLFHMKLVIPDGLSQILALTKEKNFSTKVDHHTLEIFLPEHEIPPFLECLSTAKIPYASITITEPSLEDYFLQLSKGT